jgi:hypothetical protein
MEEHKGKKTYKKEKIEKHKKILLEKTWKEDGKRETIWNNTQENF